MVDLHVPRNRHETPTPAGRPVRPSAATLTTLRSLLVLVVALTLSTETIPMALRLVHASPQAWPGTVLLLGSQLLSLVCLRARRHLEGRAWALFAMMLLGTHLVAVERGDFHLMWLLIPGYWSLPMLVMVMTTLERRRILRFAGAIAVILLAYWLLYMPPHTWLEWSDVVWVVQPILVVAALGDVLVMTGNARAREQEGQQHAQLLKEHADIESQGRREAARLLHDHVLHALHALSRASDPQLRELAIDECRTAHSVMTRTAVVSDDISLHELIAHDPALTRTGAVLMGQSEALPRGVAEAIAAATHEALQNVARHAGARHTEVRVDHDNGTVRVQVVDDGQGFDPDSTAVGRLGVGSSILARMDDIGGEAITHSRPGVGTRVELRWPRLDDDLEFHRWRAVPERRLRLGLMRTVWPGLVAGLAMTLLAGPRVEHPILGIATALVTLAIGAAGCARLARQALTRGWMTALLVVACAAWLVNLLLVPQMPSSDYYLWLAWCASALVQLVITSTSPALGLRVALAWTCTQAAGLLWRYGSWGAVWDLTATITTGAGQCFITALVLAVGRHTNRQTAEAAQVATLARVATARLNLTAHLHQYWSERVTQEALPLLADVAHERVDPADPAVRQRAVTMETSLRDELVLGPEHAATISQLARARARGWLLVSTLSPDDPVEALAGAGRLLAVLGLPEHPGQRVTVSTSPSRAVAVILGATPEQTEAWRTRLDAIGGVTHVDPEFTRLGLPTHV